MNESRGDEDAAAGDEVSTDPPQAGAEPGPGAADADGKSEPTLEATAVTSGPAGTDTDDDPEAPTPDAPTPDAPTPEAASPWRSGPRAWLWRLPLLGVGLTVLAVLPFRWIRPPTSAFMLLYGGAEARASWEWVDLGEVSPEVAIAVVASEDQRFPVHRGIDLEAVREALNERGGQVRGASTISQQVAKNLYLWSGRSWIRKGLEAWLTVAIETLWPKRRILETYLNVAQFGPATFGVAAASRTFFGVEPRALNRTQASLLAVVLPSPRRMRPDRPSPYMLERAQWVRDQIRMLGGPAYLNSVR